MAIPQTQSTSGQMIFNWPDETASNFFIRQYIETGHFFYNEPLNGILQGIAHPRSTNVVGSNIVPTGFLGMIILYGWIGKLAGMDYILFLTPLLAALTPLFFYGLIKRIFNEAVGFISAILMFGLASFWYYANLSMLSNSVFLFLLFAGMYFFSKQKRSNYIYSVLSALFLGFALITRPIEFIWVGILVVVPFIFYHRKVSWKQILLFIIFSLIPLAILFYYNKSIYNEFFTVGYLRMNTDQALIDRLPSEFQVSGGSTLISYLKFIFVPFGFHPRVILSNFNKYFIQFLNVYFWLAIVGVIAWSIRYFIIKSDKIKSLAKERIKLLKTEKAYLISAILAGAWLVFYYGNWLFVDPLVLKYNTIGSSYARYFCSAHILMLPLIAWVLFQIWKMRSSKILRYSLVSIILVGVTVYSASLVYLSPKDGLFAQKQVLEQYYAQFRKVSGLIGNGALIITDRADKVFFPQNKVVVFNGDYSIFPLLNKIVGKTPVYYFTMLPDKDIDYINKTKLTDLKMKFSEPQQIDAQFRLFRLGKTI
ncbi:MAG: hypothetical protein V1928_03230 [Parcubacteria group bacterium]